MREAYPATSQAEHGGAIGKACIQYVVIGLSFSSISGYVHCGGSVILQESSCIMSTGYAPSTGGLASRKAVPG